MHHLLTLILLRLLPSIFQHESDLKISEVEKWKLGWRMVISSMDKNYELGEHQFDSLLATKSKIDKKFILTGLQILKKRNKEEKFNLILKRLDGETLELLCSKKLINNSSAEFEYCKNFNHDVSNPELQLELIKMYINDQVSRGGKMDDIITRYRLKKEEVIKANDAVAIDQENRDKLKVIFTKYGFPSKKMVGSDAMNGIFLMIQHSDGDKVWQKSQLSNIERAVKSGDMDGQSYAYLYDRIKINSGEKQLYGTQFAKVDPINKIAELAATEDLENLDTRRMKIGMMPIETYRAFMLKSAQQ